MEKRWFRWVVRSLILREILKVTNFWSPSDHETWPWHHSQGANCEHESKFAQAVTKVPHPCAANNAMVQEYRFRDSIVHSDSKTKSQE